MSSGDNLAASELPGIFSEFGESGSSRRYLVICRSRSRRKHDEMLPADASCRWYFNIKSVEDVAESERADLGIVLNQIEHMRRTDAMHLLSALRDRFCERVLVRMENDLFSDRELLALGYIKQKRPSGDGRYYLFDPNEFFEGREWNTPSDWAHPENFKRTRW